MEEQTLKGRAVEEQAKKERVALEKTIVYMKEHWPSKVKHEWQVGLEEYGVALGRVLADLTPGRSKEHRLVRIAGLSGSGKTTQLLPAAEAYFRKSESKPILIAAREFVKYHPHYQEILECYGEAEVRKMTDEFSTIMMFLTLNQLTKDGYDIILDVALLDPEIEKILVEMTETYEMTMLMVAVAPEVAERHLSGRDWRHTRETELEFMRATGLALDFYAISRPEMRVVIWNTYEAEPVYDGEVIGAMEVFREYSRVTKIPKHDEAGLREAKIRYMTAGI